MINAFWQSKDEHAGVWLQDRDSGQRLADITLDEAIRLRDSLTVMIGHCLDYNENKLNERIREVRETKKKAGQ